jgi:3-hydroxyacyl-CoA dehydrogenase
VEIVGGAKPSKDTIERAEHFYTSLGKRTVRLNKEVPGHVANRLQAALAREVYHLVTEDVVSVADVDTALCWGPGLRWGIMGQVLLNHLGGGQGGIEHFFQHRPYHRMVEGPWLTSANAGGAAQADRRRARRGWITLHR